MKIKLIVDVGIRFESDARSMRLSLECLRKELRLSSLSRPASTTTVVRDLASVRAIQRMLSARTSTYPLDFG